MRTIAVVNQKGGCGKTTTAINLAAQLARLGKRVLLVDLDPQSHCAAGLGVPEQRIEVDISDALLAAGGKGVDNARLLWRAGRNLDLAPSRMRLAGLEASRGGLADAPNKERRLATVLESLASGYDYAIIDCSPSIGLLTYNALAAADLVIVPVETGFFSLQGAMRQFNTVRTLGRRLGKPIPVRILPTLHDESSVVAADVLKELHTRFKDKVAPVVIRRETKLREAASFGQPICDYAPTSNGAEDYSRMATWLLRLNATIDDVCDTEELDVSVVSGRETSVPAAASVGQTPAAPAPVPVAVAESTPQEVKLMSRAEDVARRAQEFLRRVSLGRVAHTTEPAQTLDHAESAPHPTLRIATEIKPVAPHPTVRRIFGVTETSQGLLFVQPLSVGARVSVAGDFNGWSADSHVMTRNVGLGVWELCIKLPPGRHRYRIVMDGHWSADSYNDRSEPNPFGESNSIVEVTRQPILASA
jgi:chromosome partitioning protein